MTSDDKTTSSQTQFEFQAEVSRLLDLMVHSVYSEREIFLRELISNAADALDKLRYESVARPGLVRDDSELRILLQPDKAARTLKIGDNGIGMTRDEMIENLGTIAHSGTRAFLERAKEDGGDKLALIGQFGVGFYSAFMVADKVEVISRNVFADTTWVWTSDGSGTFDITKATPEQEAQLQNGTIITLHLKEDALDYLEEAELSRIVRTYSDHVTFPIRLLAPGTTDDSEEEGKQLNAASALWRRRPDEIDEKDYKDFYHHVAGMWDEPRLRLHWHAEGLQEFTVLLFVPGSQPFDLYDPNRKGRVKLYVRRVFISDDAEILPAYLRFLRGVIDSEDMPLNLSREMLQNNATVAAIRKAVTGKVLSELKKFAEKDAEGFAALWQDFGAVLKEGIYEDPERRDALFEICRFTTTRSDQAEGSGLRSLKDYVADMHENQKAIYYLVGEKAETLRISPQLEGFRARNVEVLLLSDPVDNFWVTTALGYQGKPFRSITQGNINLDDIPLAKQSRKRRRAEPDQETVSNVVRAVAEVLGEAVSEVRESRRLVSSPACLVAPEGGSDRALEKLLEKQQGNPARAPVLEINPKHEWINLLLEKSRERAAGNEDSRKAFEDLAWILFDQANILDGTAPADPLKYTERLNRLIFRGE